MELPSLSETSSGNSKSVSPTSRDRLFGVALPLPGLSVYPGGGVPGCGGCVIEFVLLCILRSRISPIERRIEGIVGRWLDTMVGST